VWRAEQAQRRRPRGGLVSLDDVLGEGEDRRVFEPRHNETAEDVFNRVWACDVLQRVLKVFREECQRTGKTAHLEIFELRIVKPAIEDSEPPALEELARRYGLTEKQVANTLVTSRRAFQRLLRAEILTYALSEQDVNTELKDLFEFLAVKDGSGAD
jgi:hypothetical protein